MENISFRTLKQEDLNELAVILNSPLVCKNTPFGPNSFEETFAYFSPILEKISTSNEFSKHNFLIAIISNQKVIGNFGVFNVESENTYEIGYNLSEEFWNKGIISKAIKRICAILIYKKRPKNIIAKVMSNNSASIRVLEKNGFKIKKISEKIIIKKGKQYDEILLELKNN